MGQTIMRAEQVGARREGVHKGGIRQRYSLDEPGRRLLLACYDGRSATITDLARRLAVPRWKVIRWANDLGLARGKAPRWTAAEDTYIETYAHQSSIVAIATHLGRTPTAVRIRMKRFLGIAKSSNGYTLRRLCACLGCDHHKVERWIAAGWLRGERRHSERTALGDIWYFSDAAVRALIVEHPQEIDPRRADWLWLVDILAGGYNGLGALSR